LTLLVRRSRHLSEISSINRAGQLYLAGIIDRDRVRELVGLPAPQRVRESALLPIPVSLSRTLVQRPADRIETTARVWYRLVEAPEGDAHRYFGPAVRAEFEEGLRM